MMASKNTIWSGNITSARKSRLGAGGSFEGGGSGRKFLGRGRFPGIGNSPSGVGKRKGGNRKRKAPPGAYKGNWGRKEE